MKKALTYGAVAVALVIAAILIYAATKPDSFRVERSTTINAAPERIFASINDFREWHAWSPWEKIDPAMKRGFAGSDSGVGAVYTWEGNSDVGSGRMEITESVRSAKVVIDLHFMTPFEARNISEFTITPTEGGSTVTWAIYGPSPYISKLLTTFFDMDEMLGGQFESGLTSLKVISER